MAFKRVADVDDLWIGEMKGVVVDTQKVLLLNLEGTIYAYENRCAHQAVELSRGQLQGTVLTCFAHGWQYDAQTGAGLNPLGVQIKEYRVRVEAGHILVDIGQVVSKDKGEKCA